MYAAKVSERVYLLDTYALGVPRTVAAYLVKGPKPTLVDCGYASSFSAVLEGLSEAGVAPSEVRYVIPTHVHLDHAGAAGRLLREMPAAQVLAHERAVPHLVDPTRLLESANRVFGPEIMRLYGDPEPIPSERVTAVGEEAALDLGDGLEARILHTPGHAPHQVSVGLAAEGVAMTADAVGIVYPGFKSLIPTTPPPSFEPELLVSSLEILKRLGPKKLLTPHFGARDDVEWVLENTASKMRRWVGRIRELRDAGATLDGAAAEMEKEVLSEEGSALPGYAKVSVRASVMGILLYLSKNP